jgi:hypothetical protein
MAIKRPKITDLQRVPLEVNRRVGKGALCAPCPPLATDRVDGVPKKCVAFFGVPRHGARNQACMSLERLERARLCPPYKRDPVSSGPAVAQWDLVSFWIKLGWRSTGADAGPEPSGHSSAAARRENRS